MLSDEVAQEVRRAKLAWRKLRGAYWAWRLRCEAAEFALFVSEARVEELLRRCESVGVSVDDLDLTKPALQLHAKKRRFEWKD